MDRKWVLFIAALCCPAIWAAGQIRYAMRPDAGIEFNKGQAAEKIGNRRAAAEYYRNAVILDPDCVECVSALAKSAKTAPRDLSFGSQSQSLSSLRALYLARIASFPDNPVYQWAVAELDDTLTQDLAERYYRAAIAIRPDFAKAYEGLAATLSFRGDLPGERQCLRKAWELQPENADALAVYAQRILESDPNSARKLTADLLKMSRHPAGADLLARLAAFDPNLTTRIATLEQLKAYYPVSENDTTEWNMRFLFDAYNRTDPLKALALAQEMVLLMSPRSEAGRDWLAISKFQQSHIQARSLMERKSYEEAARELKDAKVPYLISFAPHSILHAQALEMSGKAEEAYQVLIRAMAAQPCDELKTAVAAYAQKRNKSDQQAATDILSFRAKGAQRPADFDLSPSLGSLPTKLSQYRGRVVLLDFWNPGSITARDDFPHLERILDKYGDKGLTIITINTRPDMPVAPLLTARYSFVALRAPDPMWIMREYYIPAMPYYLLLDRQGRALYQPQFGSYDAQRNFELEVEMLLGK